ncbi:hypothetical protein MW887_003580 [Aspergillus wentii]|nr:hypothetical protein MW887_003580 [Aspergillus wentii]
MDEYEVPMRGPDENKSELAHLFSGIARVNIPDCRFGLQPLSYLTKWLYRDGFTKSMLRRRYYHSVYSSTFRPLGSLTAHHPYENHYLILAIKHGIIGDDRLLKGEVLVIAAAMSSRMTCETFENHMPIPVGS